MMRRQNPHTLTPKSLFGVLAQGLVEHAQNIGCDVVERDLGQADQGPGVVTLDVRVQEVVQLGREFDAGGAAACA